MAMLNNQMVYPPVLWLHQVIYTPCSVWSKFFGRYPLKKIANSPVFFLRPGPDWFHVEIYGTLW